MKLTTLALLGVLVLSTGAYPTAMDPGPGGYIYWSVSATTSTMQVWRQKFDASWAPVGAAENFDCLTQVPFYNNSIGTTLYMNRNVEVMDPRTSGGTGSLDLVLHTDDCASRYYWYQDMLDIWKISNPTGTPVNSLLCGGRTGPAWDTRDLGTAISAPANWVPGTTSNGVSLVTSRNTNRVSYGVGSYYLHNATGSILDCTSASTGFNLINSADYPNDGWGPAPTVRDQEFGPDKALYRLIGADGTVLRCWPKNPSMDCTSSSVFFNNNVAAFIGEAESALAVGTGNLGKTVLHGTASASPVVYLNGHDSSGKKCIFGFQDVNNDNTITPGVDNVQEVWQDGQNGLTIGNGSAMYIMQDIEAVVDPTSGRTFLLFDQCYNGGAYVLELADNGLAAVNTGTILGSGMPQLTWVLTGFEVDLSPVPEPCTMLLLGTGALGALGCIRRRRVR